MKRQLILSLLAVFSLSTFSQTEVSFQTNELRRIATALKLERLDTLPSGTSDIHDGKNAIVIRKNDNGVVNHIGIRVFPNAYRMPENTTIFDYVENALLYNTYKISDNKLKLNDVKFIAGNWQNLLNIAESVTFSMNVIDNKAYQLIWTEKGKKIIDMLVPVKYDVLNNTPRKELEHNFVRDLRAFKPKSNNKNIDAASMRMVRDGKDTLYVSYSKQYLQDNITNSTYYQLVGDSSYIPVLSEMYPTQSMANLALLGKCGKCNARIRLTVIGEDNYKETIDVDMINLLEYTASCGCSAYFGFESEDNEVLKGSLFFYNKESGYDHVLSLQCNKNDLNKESVLFTSRAYLFTPTTNVKNLYSDIYKK